MRYKWKNKFDCFISKDKSRQYKEKASKKLYFEYYTQRIS